MIHVKSSENEYLLSWNNGSWRDRAGHVWTLDPKGVLRSPIHGTYYDSQYSVIPLELENDT